MLYKVRFISNTKAVAKGHCSLSMIPYETKPFSAKGYQRWRNGTLIHTALPELDLDDKEFLMSGISPTGWEMQFEDE